MQSLRTNYKNNTLKISFDLIWSPTKNITYNFYGKKTEGTKCVIQLICANKKVETLINIFGTPSDTTDNCFCDRSFISSKFFLMEIWLPYSWQPPTYHPHKWAWVVTIINPCWKNHAHTCSFISIDSPRKMMSFSSSRSRPMYDMF